MEAGFDAVFPLEDAGVSSAAIERGFHSLSGRSRPAKRASFRLEDGVANHSKTHMQLVRSQKALQASKRSKTDTPLESDKFNALAYLHNELHGLRHGDRVPVKLLKHHQLIRLLRLAVLVTLHLVTRIVTVRFSVATSISNQEFGDMRMNGRSRTC